MSVSMNPHPILNKVDVDAQRCPERVGPKVFCDPELPGESPRPDVLCADTEGRGDSATASMESGIEALARAALSRRLEDYELEAVLGKGAFGCVYQAKDLSAGGQGRRVAIKQIPRANVAGEHRELVFTEKSILSLLTTTNSPYFTPLIESFTDPLNFTIVQGLAPGGNLRDAMYNSKTLFRMHEVKFLMAQLVRPSFF